MPAAAPYRTEERFVELFTDVFGPAAAGLLVEQRDYVDIEGHDRRIDFALETLLSRYAIEIDGETYHHPGAVSSEDYADQLVRQNSLTHLGWSVLRWSDWQLAEEPHRVKEHLSILLDTGVRLTIPADHLPCKRGTRIELMDHQEEALGALAALRAEGNQIALLSHAVGSGKTTTAIEDARRLGARTLFLAHTHELVDQAIARFGDLWPEQRAVRLGDADTSLAPVVVGTVQSMVNRLADFDPGHFGYIVIDEAHHATAREYQAVLRYFDPDFLLGLTGTEERADGQSALDVFVQAAHRLALETAVKQGILCDVRCFRVETNVDLRNLRFGGVNYKQADLEKRVTIPSRNDLLVRTYADNVPSKRAVCFCVTVEHAEAMARLFRAAGFGAQAVSGRLDRGERKRILDAYRSGEVRVLCARDVLNEGWDAPETEVLLMARPTLSKVVYQQQLGRGMRKYPGKEALILFDFVDVFGRHNQALSVHRLTKKPQYRAGSRVFGDDDGATPADLPLHLWCRDLVDVAIFDWQERVEGMVTACGLARLLRVSEGWVIDRVKKGQIPADETVDLGGGAAVAYFSRERVPGLRQQFGLSEVTEDNLYDDLVRFLAEMDMSASYKPVWFDALLRLADEHGRAKIADVAAEFHRFYLARDGAGLLAERGARVLCNPAGLSPARVQTAINQGPLNRFERLGFVRYARDRAYYEIPPTVWKRLHEPAAKAEALRLCEEGVRRYFG
ncbi:MAG: DEAD/DEAH box helicase family protein [Armatimonadetes bacterium]|nr:DEAD/DEAH box helicase family protein [Armatimonadota bacterium]